MSREGFAGALLVRGAGRPAPTAAAHALELGSQRLLIAEGEHVVGRASDCDIVLDSDLVSRRHARLTVMGASVFVEDFGSVNGVTVDGTTVRGKTLVPPNSRLGFADVEVVLRHRASSEARQTRRVPTSGPDRRDSGVDPVEGGDARERRARAFQLLASVVDKALAMGKPEEAERLVGGLLREVLEEAERGHSIPDEVCETATHHALSLAAATQRSEWADYGLRLYLARERVMPLAFVDRLYSVARGLTRIDGGLLRQYEELLDGLRLSPADRFVLQRLRSLMRMLGPSR